MWQEYCTQPVFANIILYYYLSLKLVFRNYPSAISAVGLNRRIPVFWTLTAWHSVGRQCNLTLRDLGAEHSRLIAVNHEIHCHNALQRSQWHGKQSISSLSLRLRHTLAIANHEKATQSLRRAFVSQVVSHKLIPFVMVHWKLWREPEVWPSIGCHGKQTIDSFLATLSLQPLTNAYSTWASVCKSPITRDTVASNHR